LGDTLLKKELTVTVVVLFLSISIIPNVIGDNSSFGNTIYVDDDNISGPWDGSLEHPFQHIQDAIDDANSGDIVFVYSGTYFENVVVDKSINLIGEDKNTTIIDGSINKDKDVICVTASHVNIEKFTIKNGKNGILIDGDYGVVDNLNIVENIIIDNIQYGVFFFRSGYNTVLNNIITNNIYGIRGNYSVYFI
jgi:parallel beta-helix repeat protein